MTHAAVSTPWISETAIRVGVLVLAGTLLSGGCHREASPPEMPSAANSGLIATDATGLAEAVARRRGRVVLVEFWATWCAPCVKLFPHTIDLHRRLADQGLDVISVSMDDPKSREAVLRFLRERGATSESFISRYGLGSEGFEAFAIDDGALPHLRLYDRDSRLRATFAGGGDAIDPGPIERAVRDLLKP